MSESYLAPREDHSREDCGVRANTAELTKRRKGDVNPIDRAGPTRDEARRIAANIAKPGAGPRDTSPLRKKLEKNWTL